MSPIELNTKSVTVATILTFVFIYVIYTYMSATPSEGTSQAMSKSSRLKLVTSWKTQEFVDIPIDVMDNVPQVKVSDRHTTIKLGSKTLNIHFKEALPVKGQTAKFTVLLLHGAAFSSKTWIDNVVSKSSLRMNTVSMLAAAGYHVIALDLPGWGESKGARVSEEERPSFLASFIEHEHLDRPVIVSPSMSGSFSVPYIMGDSPNQCTQKVRGYVPVAPVMTDMYSAAQWHRCETPTMIVYGTKDTKLGLFSLNNLRNLPNSEIFAIEDGSHPCYIDFPDEWHRILYNFLRAVEREG